MSGHYTICKTTLHIILEYFNIPVNMQQLMDCLNNFDMFCIYNSGKLLNFLHIFSLKVRNKERIMFNAKHLFKQFSL